MLPGAGDVLTGAAGLYLVVAAARAGTSPVLIARMLLNLAVDMLVGAVPLVGDLFDFAFRANLRNLALLERSRTAGGRASPGDWAVMAGAVLLFLLALAIPIALLVLALRALWP